MEFGIVIIVTFSDMFWPNNPAMATFSDACRSQEPNQDSKTERQ